MLEPLDVKLRTIFHSVLAIARAVLPPEAHKEFIESLGIPQKQKPKPMSKICLHCGEKFLGRGFKFCSSRCSALNSRTPASPRPCKRCQKDFYSPKPRRYCDPCRMTASRPKEPKFCAVCSESFLPIQSGQKFCTPACKARWFNKRGNASGRLRQQLLESVGRCEYCGEADRTALHAHHINGHSAPELMLLCANCHQKYHRQMGQSVFAETRTREDVLRILRTGEEAKALLENKGSHANTPTD